MVEQDDEAPETAYLKKVSEFAGSGCLIQGLGLLAPFVGALAGSVGIGIGLVIMVALFLVGSRNSVKWCCGKCGNPVADGEVRMCSTCKVALRPAPGLFDFDGA